MKIFKFSNNSPEQLKGMRLQARLSKSDMARLLLKDESLADVIADMEAGRAEISDWQQGDWNLICLRAVSKLQKKQQED